MTRPRRWQLGLLAVAGMVAWSAVSMPSADATAWLVAVASGSAGESQAKALPAPPGGVAAACAAPTTAKTIKVTWSAVSLATSYTAYNSTTSATGTYTSVATGVAGTSWTSGALTSGTHYWYKIAALIGTKWTSPQSSATGSSTINSTSPFCVQP